MMIRAGLRSCLRATTTSRGFSWCVNARVQEQYEVDGFNALPSANLERADVMWLRQNCEIPPRKPDVEVRRNEFSKIVDPLEYGAPFNVEYSEEEHGTWRHLHQRLRPLWDAHATPEYLANLAELDATVELDQGVPNMDAVAGWLTSKSGFTLVPVVNLIKARSFLTALSMRVMFCCSPMRPHSQLYLSEEPDALHDLLGHVPMLADNDFADMVQCIGLMSLHADEKEMHQLAMLYWHLVEFAVSAGPNGEAKIGGAAILSSEGEIKHVASVQANILPYSNELANQSEYEPVVKGFQPVYLQTQGVADARAHVMSIMQSGYFKRTEEQWAAITEVQAKYPSQPRVGTQDGSSLMNMQQYADMSR